MKGLIFSLLYILFSLTTYGQEFDKEKWQLNIDLGLKQGEIKKYDLGIQYFKKSCHFIGDVPTVENIYTQITLNYIGNFFWSKGDIIESTKYYRKSLEICKKISESENNCIGLMGLLVSNLSSMKKNNEAIKLGKEQLRLIENIQGQKSNEYRKAINSIGFAYFDNEQFIQAYNCATKFDNYDVENIQTVLLELNLKGLTEVKLGKLEQSILTYKKYLEIKKSTNSLDADYWDIVSLLAGSYYNLGRYDSSIFYKKQHLEYLEFSKGKSSNLYLNNLLNLGNTYRAASRYEESAKIFLKTIEFLKMGTQDFSLLNVNAQNGLALAYLGEGNYLKSKEIYIKIIKYNNELLNKNNLLFSTIYNNYSIVLNHLDKNEEALKYDILVFDKVKSLYPESHFAYKHALKSLAGTYDKVGNFKEAEKYYLLANKLVAKYSGKNSLDYLNTNYNLATFYMNNNYINQSEMLIKDGLERYFKMKSQDEIYYSYMIIKSDLNLANNNYRGALQDMQAALDFVYKIQDANSVIVAHVKQKLSNIYSDLGQNGVAMELMQEVKFIRMKNGLKGRDYADALHNLAGLQTKLGQLDSAYLNVFEAINILKNNGLESTRGMASHFQLLGDIMSNMNYDKNSIIEYKKAEAILSKLNGCNSCEVLYNNMSQSYSKLKKKKDALNYMLKASDLDSGNDKANLVRLNNLIMAYDDLEYFSKSKPLILQASELFQKEVDNVFSFGNDVTRKRFIQKKRSSLFCYKQSYFARPDLDKEIKSAILNNQLKYKNLLLNTKISVSQELKSLKPVTLKKTVAFNWQAVSHSLKESDLAIEYDMSTSYGQLPFYFASIIEPNHKSRLQKLGKMRSIKPDSLSSFLLFNKIITPININTAKGSDIYFSPSGPLNNVSFSSLKNKDGTYLCELYDLYQLSSLGKLAENRKEPRKKSFLFYGGINYNNDRVNASNEKVLNESFNLLSSIDRSVKGTKSRGDSWMYLPGTLEEVNQIGKLADNYNIRYTIKKDLEASEEEFRKLDGNSPSVIHLATHGYFFENSTSIQDVRTQAVQQNENTYKLSQDPLIRSGLILAGGNKSWLGNSTLPAEKDGILTAYEIAKMDLSNTNLVVLSACETAKGDIDASEGVFGLQRAFKLAGVDYIIMSLWAVPDKETSEFMKLFYTYWLGGMKIYPAFQKTQREMIKLYRNDPKKWAGFILVY